ncbi:MAG: class I SAM-dependent methyltransferase [Bacteroidales bacterium]|jgi:SAM-dependent methyltransferase|nr:class I SAM-dependent methyltransferase [Bacteroidales bacterium]
MTEFWEESFRDKQAMWGFEPSASAITTLELFKKNGLNKILIPGFGYGRNANLFIQQGFEVSGIEISATAIALAKKHYGPELKIHHGSVSAMPFDQERYDGIFCYALIHLLNEAARKKLIEACYRQLNVKGYMVFIALSKHDARYGNGEVIGKNTFKTKHGISLFFYDPDAVQEEFGNFGLVQAEELSEPAIHGENNPPQQFIQIICRK